MNIPLTERIRIQTDILKFKAFAENSRNMAARAEHPAFKRVHEAIARFMDTAADQFEKDLQPADRPK